MDHAASHVDADSHHDHAGCGDRDHLMARAERVCAAAGDTLTPLRRRVLGLLIDAGGPSKAYDLMARVSEDGVPAKPPTVYRTLDFLMRHGLAHRIESLNAWVACGHAHEHGTSAFMICRECGASREMAVSAVASALQQAAGSAGFVPDTTIIELTGLCAGCAARRP
jgi:Fur family zinc uptake transcriptional regulator